MTLKIQADTFARDNAPAFLGKNIRKYKWSSFTGEVAHNSLGGVSFGADAQGKVVEQKEGWTLVKLSASTFKVLRTELLSQEVAIGDTIDMKFYKLRRFDGSPADGSDDPAVDGCRSFMLTGAKTKFPVAGEDRYLEHSFQHFIAKHHPKLAKIMELDPDSVFSNVRGFQIAAEIAHPGKR